MKYSQALEIFETHLSKISFEGEPKELYDPIRYTMEMGGKRIRPALLLMAGAMYHNKMKSFLNAAIGIEIFHNFTLVHDDIMDNAPLRRGQASVHKKWNRDIAILSGDVMFVTACQYISKCKPKHIIPVLELFHETAVKVCEGQQMDMNFESQVNVGIEEYMKMIEMKTAVLLACSLKIGAIVGGAGRDEAEKIYEFGKHIGIAFQLQDDILDAFAKGKEFGKRQGGDIISNKKTFLYISALEKADKQTAADFHRILKIKDPSEKVGDMLKIYDKLKIRVAAEEKMNSCFNRGLDFLNEIQLPEEKKKPLRSLAESLMHRIA